MSGPEVIVCGSLHLDIVVRAPHLPRLDETAVGTAWEFACGGKGRNQAVQAARAGARVAMIGRVGQDAFGASLLASLDQVGVDRREVAETATGGSGMSVAIMNPEGSYGAVIVSGVNLQTSPDDVTRSLLRLGGARVLVLQNEVPEPVNVAAARALRGAGGLVMLNAAPARELGPELADLLDILVVNRVEAMQMAGLPVDNPSDAVVAAGKLVAASRCVVVTLGGEGLVLASPGTAAEHIPAAPVETVVTTHGAGDCFVGTLAARLSTGETLATACRTANLAAARFVAGLSETG